MGLTNYLAKAQTLGMSRSGALFLLFPVTKSSNCRTSPNPRYAATYTGNDSSALARRAMRKSVLLAFMLSISPIWLPTPSSASDKRHDPETLLVKVEGCLKMSATEYVLIDDTGTRHNLIVSAT